MSTYKNFLNKLENSLQIANRRIEDIELIAVSKKKSITDIQSVIDEGHYCLEKIKFKKLRKKWPELKKS